MIDGPKQKPLQYVSKALLNTVLSNKYGHRAILAMTPGQRRVLAAREGYADRVRWAR